MAPSGTRQRSFTTRALGRAQTSEAAWIRRLVSAARSTYRYIGRTIPALHLGWVSQVVQVVWDDECLQINGWGYTRGSGFARVPQVEVSLHRRWRRAVLAEVVSTPDPRVNGAARKAEFDYANTAFQARWDAAALSQVTEGGARQVRVRISGRGRRFWGPIRRLNPYGSGATMSLRRDHDGTLVGPVWNDRRGLLVVRRKPALNATHVDVSGRLLTVSLDRAANSLSLVSGSQEPVELLRVPSSDGLTFAGTLPPRRPAFDAETGRPVPSAWSLQASGPNRPVHLAGAPVESTDSTPVLVRGDGQQRVEVVDTAVFVEVRTAELEGDTVLRLEGRIVGDATGIALALVGGRARLPVEVTMDGETFVGRARLRVSAWGGPELPPMRGAYALLASAAGETLPTYVANDLSHSMPQTHLAADYRLQFQLDGRDQFRLHVGRPLRASEFGSYNQAQLQLKHNSKPRPRDAVFFESFVGRNATCNPRAMDAEVARRYPDLPRYWSVDDLSIAVPDGGLPLVIGTAEWWQARTSARWVVTNEWLRTTFRKHRFQTVIQTWHGSMYKKIGLDRANMNRRHFRLLREERAKWDKFISQNAPSTEIIKQAYEFADADVIEAGYPRNDELLTVDDERRATIRAKLGVPPDALLAMYAPTWRVQDVEGDKVELVDLPRLANDLGSSWIVLLRGHVRTLKQSDAVENDGILDVGTYPQVSELFMVADVLITDYSSMMFDFSVTGKPIVFFAPDIDEYANDRVRGAYFDLEALAPGPVIRTQAELRDLLLADNLGWHADFAERYAAWHTMFNHLDDGMASSRAVDALFGRGSPSA